MEEARQYPAVMDDLTLSLIFFFGGLVLASHCALATLREFKRGRALGGIYGDYDRQRSPLGFWAILAGNAAAALLGALFVIAGIVGLLAYQTGLIP